MILTIAKIRRTPKPSSYKPGTFWNLTEIKSIDHGDQIFELVGFGKDADKLVEGGTIEGYISQKTWNNVVTKTINKVTADYVYRLLLKVHPDIENQEAVSPSKPASLPNPNDGFNKPTVSSGGTSEPAGPGF